ncbi:MAG: hypothetical protein AAF549_08890 [Pseudomonadota bacterium]
MGQQILYAHPDALHGRSRSSHQVSSTIISFQADVIRVKGTERRNEMSLRVMKDGCEETILGSFTHAMHVEEGQSYTFRCKPNNKPSGEVSKWRLTTKPALVA